jgi:hypothetical protein
MQYDRIEANRLYEQSGRQNVASYFCNELNMDWRLELLTLSHSSSIMMLVAIGVIGPTAG